MRQPDKKYFGDVQQGRLNSDDSPFVVGANEWVNAENIRTGSTDKGFTGVVESVGGNAELPEPLPLYEEVKIGNQIWMSKNFDLDYYPGGIEIQKVTNLVDFNNATVPVWCYPNFDDANAEYGKLYNYLVFTQPESIAPVGWRVPTPSDFQNLKLYIGSDGDKLKESGTAHWNSPNTGTNQTGFSAYGAGSTDSGTFRNIGYFWADDTQTIYYLNNSSNVFDLDQAGQGTGYSLRLIKNTSQVPNQYIAIGSVEDTENKRLIHFECDLSSNKQDRIVCLYTNTNTSYTVLLSSQVKSNIVDYYIYGLYKQVTYQVRAHDGYIVIIDNGVLFNLIGSGYKIVISGGTPIDGTYIVQSTGLSPTNTIFLPTTGFVYPDTVLQTGFISIFRNTPVYYKTGLNFSKDSLIHSAKISNGNILSFPDSTNNEPRKINIESAIKANYPSFDTTETPYQFPLEFSEVTFIKRPPIYTPNILKGVDATNSTNFIYKTSFQFAFQYEYYDGEISVISSYSQSSFLNSKTDNFNTITVSMDKNEKIPSIVERINLVARVNDNTLSGGNYSVIVRTWDKGNINDLLQIENQNNKNIISVLQYFFYYDSILKVIASDDTLRAFDNVPIFSQTHEVSKNRYFLANNTLGYNTPSSTSLIVNLNNSITPSQSHQAFRSVYIGSGNYKSTWYGNNYFRWTRAGIYLYIDISTVRTGFYLIPDTFRYYIDVDTPASPGLPAAASYSLTQLVWSGATIREVQDAPPNPGNPWATTDRISYWNTSVAPFIEVTGLSSVTYSALSQNSSYNLGVVFYDYAMRKCGVCNNSNREFDILSGMEWDYNANTGLYGFILSAQVAVPLKLGQIIKISGLPNSNGTYVVNNAYASGANWFVYVQETVTTFIASPGTLSYTVNGITLNTPYRDYAYSSAYQNGLWELSNTNAINEIPEWAYYYSVVSTLNLRTRFFFQSVSNQNKYAQKDSVGGNLYQSVFPGVSLAFAIAINVSSLYSIGLGYTYEETNNDICILISDTNDRYELPVIGQDGNYILLKPVNIGNDISNKYFSYDIYTPYKKTENEPYYEIGEIYSILNPKTASRTYEILNGIIAADTYILNRVYNSNTSIEYFASAMSPNDLYWKTWISNAGKTNQVIRIGQKVNNTNISWSDTYISGTEINGSSTFRLGNETFVSDDCGSITKLQLTSKVQDQGQGSVMLALCNSEINSMYLGETQITDSTGKTQFFSASSSVVSTINILKGNYGCISPESVVQYRGKVYFVDLANGRIVQYSDNGLDAISNVKMSKFWKNWSSQYLNMNMPLSEVNISSSVSISTVFSNANTTIDFTSNGVINSGITINIYLNSDGVPPILISTYTTIGGESLLDITQELALSISNLSSPVYGVIASSGQLRFTYSNATYSFQGIIITSNPIEALGDRPFVFAMVDPGHDELLISLPKLSNISPKGYLPDYPSTPYPFDILDYQGKTLVYCLGTAAQVYPHWQGAYTFTTENFVSLQNRLFSFKGGRIFEHNQDIQNRFYGAYSPSSIMFTSNILSQVPKVYDNFVVESNLMPSFVYFYNNYPYIQTSDLDDTSFVNLEGIWYANILRNKIVPTTTGFTTDGLLTAEVMRNTNMYVQATFSPTTSPLELRLIQLGTSISKGHIIT